MELSAALRENVEQVLGRTILPSERGNVAFFSNFSEEDIAEFRLLAKISSTITVGYVLYRLKENVGLQEAALYCEYVVRQGMKVEDWLKL